LKIIALKFESLKIDIIFVQAKGNEPNPGAKSKMNQQPKVVIENPAQLPVRWNAETLLRSTTTDTIKNIHRLLPALTATKVEHTVKVKRGAETVATIYF
jgi:hypothetical protein